MNQLSKRTTSNFFLARILKLTSITGLFFVLLLVASRGLAGGAMPSRGAVQGDKEWKLPPDAKKMKNPIASNAASIAKGKMVYEKNCLVCHGASGTGDGVLGAKLKPKPADLTNKKEMSEYSDGEIFSMVSMGKLPMPAFEKTVTKDDRWNVVNYVRTLAK